MKRIILSFVICALSLSTKVVGATEYSDFYCKVTNDTTTKSGVKGKLTYILKGTALMSSDGGFVGSVLDEFSLTLKRKRDNKETLLYDNKKLLHLDLLNDENMSVHILYVEGASRGIFIELFSKVKEGVSLKKGGNLYFKVIHLLDLSAFKDTTLITNGSCTIPPP